MGWAGNLNFTYAVQRAAFQPRTEVASMSYSLDMFDRRLTLMASGYSDLSGENWGGTVSLIFPLGRNVRGNIDTNRSQSDSYNAVQVHGDAFDQRLNWSVVAANGQFDGGYARADWRGRYIDLSGRLVSINGSNAVDATAAQSFVFMPEGMFVAGRIDDAFTLVKVGDFPDVEVFLENRPVGRTDRQGNLLVTGLDSYVGNALSIDPRGLPMDVSTERTTALVAPRLGAGLVTRFGILEERAILVSLRLPDGGSPPVGAVAALAGSSVAGPVGFDGDVYLRGVSAEENRINVTWPGGSCTALVRGAVEPGRLRTTGAVECAP
jgi:outer membrane usher protein